MKIEYIEGLGKTVTSFFSDSNDKKSVETQLFLKEIQDEWKQLGYSEEESEELAKATYLKESDKSVLSLDGRLSEFYV